MIRNKKIIYTGGLLMVVSGLLFIGIPQLIDYLATDKQVVYNLEQFNLFRVTAGTPGIHFWLIIYAFLPLLLIPAMAATYYTFQDKYKPLLFVAFSFGLVGVTALTMSLLILPSFDWYFLSYLPTLNKHRDIVLALLQAWHSYWGLCIADMLGLGCILVWVFITSLVIFYSKLFHYLLRLALMIISVLLIFILSLHYNGATISSYIQVTALLMGWMFICGVGLMIYSVKNKSDNEIYS